MNQHWPCVAGRNVTSVSTNVTSIEDHPGSNEQFLFQVQLRKNSYIFILKISSFVQIILL